MEEKIVGNSGNELTPITPQTTPEEYAGGKWELWLITPINYPNTLDD